MIKTAYSLYFGCRIGNQDKSWAPHICCNTCAANLKMLGNWQKASYACSLKLRKAYQRRKNGLSNIQTSPLQYVRYRMAMTYQFPKCQNHFQPNDPDFEQTTSNKPHLITQSELNDLVRDLHLPKNKAELLGSRLQQWNLLAVEVYKLRPQSLVTLL